jgi:hypothetical protein
MLSATQPSCTSALAASGPLSRTCSWPMIVTLRFDGSSGREPNLQHIASLLGGDARLLYSNSGCCRPSIARVTGCCGLPNTRQTSPCSTMRPPSSTLDPENTLSVLTLLKEINQRLGLTIVLITHEMEVIRTHFVSDQHDS